MPSGDGLLVRVRITVGRVPSHLARALARGATEFGNGLIDLTSRANLQLRGVSEATLPPLQARLAELGLLDESPSAEAVRNVIVSPLAGLDPSLRADVLTLATALEARLVEDRTLHDLPHKFGFLIDGGGALPLDGVDADLRFIAAEDGRFAVEAGGVSVDIVASTGLVAAAAGWACDFLRLRQDGEARLRDMMARLRPGCRGSALQPLRAVAGHGTGGCGFLALSAPFGRVTAEQLFALADLADHHGAELRLTPWRAILLAPLAAEDAPAAAARAGARGWIVDPTDPRLFVAACPGSPACLRGEAEVRRDAARFAEALAPVLDGCVSVHVSGCAKGCARRAPSTLTLVAEAGRYGLAFGGDAATPRQTELMAPDAMAAYLAALARTPLALTRFDHA
jgi:precorrin-3B synthase